MSNDTAELKPCPFCGGKAIFGGMDFEEGDVERIECSDCGVRNPHIMTKARAIKYWNTRYEYLADIEQNR